MNKLTKDGLMETYHADSKAEQFGSPSKYLMSPSYEEEKTNQMTTSMTATAEESQEQRLEGEKNQLHTE